MKTLVIVLLAVLTVQADTPTRFDGYSWNDSTRTERLLFIGGYLASIRQSTPLMKFVRNAVVPEGSTSDNLFMLNFTKGYDLNISKEGVLPPMDIFYSNIKNAEVCWVDALQVGLLTLHGTAPSEPIIAQLRKEDAASGCRG